MSIAGARKRHYLCIRKFSDMMNSLRVFLVLSLGVVLSSCEGLFDAMYDPEVEASEGQVYVDASSWTDWYYLDLHALLDSAQVHFTEAYPIPLDTVPADQWDGQTGIYTFWYDVYGEGTSSCRYDSHYPSATQPEPERWDIAIHRDDVRTHHGAVFETDYDSMEELPATSEAFWNERFEEDRYSESDTWTVSETMLLGYVGNQRILINYVLSSWLQLELRIPGKVPPEFTHNTHVFILRMQDGTYAALRLAEYVRNDVKCRLTIDYIYPY